MGIFYMDNIAGKLINKISQQETPINQQNYYDINIFKRLTIANETDGLGYYDSEWVVNSFLVKSRDLAYPDNVNRYFSYTQLSYVDTSLGGNISLNVFPQFTTYADIPLPNITKGTEMPSVNNLDPDIGIGRYYGEVIDSNAFNVYFTFGVPEFNSMLTFLLFSGDYKQTVIANTGRSPVAYDIGKLWGTTAFLIGTGVVGLGILLAKSFIKYFVAPGRFTYYSMKPTMASYWATVNSIVTMMATELGILNPEFMPKKDKDLLGGPLKIDEEDMDFLHQYFPTIFKDNNYIDVFAIATRAQRRYLNEFLDNYKNIENTNDGIVQLAQEAIRIKKNISQYDDTSYDKYVNKLHLLGSALYGYQKPNQKESKKPDMNNVNKQIGNVVVEKHDGLNMPRREVDKPNVLEEFMSQFEATITEGAQYAIFRVENPGRITESFRNSTRNLEVEGLLKSIGSKVKTLEFNMSGGNLLPGMKDIIGYTKDILAGALDGLTIGLSNVVTSLMGDMNIEFPKRWDDSSAVFPTLTYRIRLTSPYGNPISQLQNIYIPLAALMAGALPRAAGPSAYTSPFLCSMFLRGYQYITLGMITSLTITRGTSNLAFNKQRRPLAIDVSFTVTDFSKILSMPTQSSVLSGANIMYVDDAPLNRYIAAMCGRDAYTTLNFLPRLKLKLSRWVDSVEALIDPYHLAMRAGDIVPEVVKNIFARRNLPLTEKY